MDRYTRMCEAAYEFQEGERKLGDTLHLVNNLYDHKGTLSVINNETEPVFKRGIYIYCESNIPEGENGDLFLSQCIFLPTQEDIQERFNGPASYLLTSFINFIVPSRYGSLADKHNFKELWLMFYYFHVHGKVWNEQDWVRAETVGDFFT